MVSLKCAEFGSKGNKRREGLTVQARILDTRGLLGASRSVRIEGGSKDEGRTNLKKSLEKSQKNCRSYRRVKMNSEGSYL